MYVVKPEETPPFEFQTPDGETHAIPAVESLPTPRLEEIARKVRAPRDPNALLDPFAEQARDLLEEYAPGVYGALTVGQFAELARAYFGVRAGESSGSSS